MKRWALTLALSVAALGAGYFAGRASLRWPLAEFVEARQRGATLGALLNDTQRALVAQAYSDPALAASELDRYAWEPRIAPAPFVGELPAPGGPAGAAIDRHGFRTRHDLTRPKPAGTTRVFLVGGSLAYSVGAPSEETTLAAQLEQRLQAELGSPARRFEVIAAAAPHWTSTHERISIENRLAFLEPDLVVALSGAADCDWGYRGMDALWGRAPGEQFHFELVQRALALAAAPPAPDLVEVGDESELAGDVAARFVYNARLASHALALRGVPYLVCLQPCRPVSELASGALVQDAADSYYTACYDELRAQLAAVPAGELRSADLSHALDASYASEHLYIDSYHLADKGNARLAAALLEALRPLLEAPK